MALTVGTAAQEIDRGTRETSRDERNMAALAQGLGIIAALPIWLAWRRRSRFVRAHAAESIVFDGITLTGLGLIAVLIVGGVVAGRAVLQDVPFFSWPSCARQEQPSSDSSL